MSKDRDEIMNTIQLPSYGIVIHLYEYTDNGTIHTKQLDTPEFQGILRIVLAHAIAGIDIESPAYLEGLETAVEAIANTY